MFPEICLQLFIYITNFDIYLNKPRIKLR